MSGVVRRVPSRKMSICLFFSDDITPVITHDRCGLPDNTPPTTSNSSLMESFPQELIDKVIDDLPHSSLHSCSLVGRRWRRRSQECLFTVVDFSSERDLVLWCANIPQGPGGIPSYVRTVRFQDIPTWDEPALFGRVLKTFTSMTSLLTIEATVPQLDELSGSVPFGEFGKKTKFLVLMSPQCTVATIVALVFSFPNLERCFLIGVVSEEPLSILPRAPQRGPLVSLRLHADKSGIGIALAQCGLTSRKLSLIASDDGVEQLISLSSEVIADLELYGMWPLVTLRKQRQY